MAKKYNLMYKVLLEKSEHKMITRIQSEPTYSDLQVRNEEIWWGVVAIPLLIFQGNSSFGDYMMRTFYAKISDNPYMALSEMGTNATYPPGAKTVARENIKYNWERNIAKYTTRDIRQNVVKKFLIKVLPDDCLEEEWDHWKFIAGVLG